MHKRISPVQESSPPSRRKTIKPDHTDNTDEEMIHQELSIAPARSWRKDTPDLHAGALLIRAIRLIRGSFQTSRNRLSARVKRIG
jgi:hypothetical protein